MKNDDYIVKQFEDGTMIKVSDIQSVLLDMMKDIDKICRNNNINYILTGGTALGAVRHGGFIPWDDDLDIAMMREDYNKLVKILKKELPDKYTFHCFEVNKKYNVTINAMKIRKKGTYIKEVNYLLANKCNDCNGIFIDVFIMDYASNNKLIDVPFRMLNDFLMLLINGFENIKINPIPLKKTFINIAKFYGKINKNSEYIGFDLTWTFISPFKGHIFKIKDVYPTTDIKFEDHKFRIANNYDSFLQIDIGKDYMTLPPVEQRFAKHTVDINLNGSEPLEKEKEKRTKKYLKYPLVISVMLFVISLFFLNTISLILTGIGLVILGICLLIIVNSK